MHSFYSSTIKLSWCLVLFSDIQYSFIKVLLVFSQYALTSTHERWYCSKYSHSFHKKPRTTFCFLLGTIVGCWSRSSNPRSSCRGSRHLQHPPKQINIIDDFFGSFISIIYSIQNTWMRHSPISNLHGNGYLNTPKYLDVDIYSEIYLSLMFCHLNGFLLHLISIHGNVRLDIDIS